MWQIILYSIAISAALGLMGLADEKLNTMTGRSRRFAWAFIMVASILWPLAAILWNQPAAAVAAPVGQAIPSMATAQVPAPKPVRTEPMLLAAEKPATPVTRLNLQPPSDRTVLLAWAIASGALLLGFASADLLLQRRASRWQGETILGQQVRVSESTGPALLGALRPAVVVPVWFLDEPAATQALILQHEQQHIAARDPLLLRLALLLVIALPWNLPLWWQLRRLRQAIELDCDARVLRSGAEAGLYGKVLLTVTQRSGNMPVAAIAMSEPASALERRIRSLAAGPARFSAWRALAVVALWGAGVGAALSVEAPAIQIRAKEPVRVAAAPTATTPATAATPATATTPATSQVAAPMSQQTPQAAPPPRSSTSQAQPAAGAGVTAAPDNAVEDVAMLIVAAEQKLQELRRRFNDKHPEVRAQAQTISELRREQERIIAHQPVQAGIPMSNVRMSPWQPLQTATPNTGRRMELRALIAQASEMFQRRFVIDPRVAGTADLGSLDPDLLSYHAFLEILGVHGFVAVPSSDVVTIMPSEYARMVASPIVRADDIQGEDSEVVTTLIPVSNATLMAAALRPLVANWGVLSVTADGKSLLLVDKVANAKRIVALALGEAQ